MSLVCVCVCMCVCVCEFKSKYCYDKLYRFDQEEKSLPAKLGFAQIVERFFFVFYAMIAWYFDIVFLSKLLISAFFWVVTCLFFFSKIVYA